jgi:hypothetical protein
MLGSFTLDGIEYIDSREQRSLVEHRVPGLAGSYFQDLGSAPNTLVVVGTRHGDDQRDAFLNGVRAIFNAGEQTTFTADINTATDITDVVIEDLQVAELAGAADSFRYVLRLRKYVEPPEPPAVGLPGLDSDLLDAAGAVVGALDTLDALASLPNLGDPTPPLREAVGGVSTATEKLAPAVEGLNAGLGEDPAGPAPLPTREELSSPLAGLTGDSASGTGMNGALAAVQGADVAGRTEALVSALDGSLAEAVPAGGPAEAADAVGRVSEAAGAMPEPGELTAPLTEPLGQIRELVASDVAGGVVGRLGGLEQLLAGGPEDPAQLVAGALEQVDRVAEGLGLGQLGAVRSLGEAVTALEAELAQVLAATAERAQAELVAFLTARAAALRDDILPGGQGPTAELVSAVDAALGRTDGIQRAAGELNAALERARAAVETGQLSPVELDAAETSLRVLAGEAAGLATDLRRAADMDAASPEGLAEALRRLHDDFRDIDVVDLGAPAEALGEAFEQARALIAEVDLGQAREAVEGVIGGVRDVVEQLELSRLTSTLDDAEASVRDALAGLDGGVIEVLALVRTGFSGLREALITVRDALGSVGEDGRFRFGLEAEIESLLTRVRSVVDDTIVPALEGFRGAVTEAIGEVTAALDQVVAEVESVKAQLQGAIQGAADQLRAADVGGTMGRVAQELDGALSQLGEIDFDPVVDPVVAQIEDMSGQLRAIDPADLNEILRAALSAAVAIIEAIDFPNDITAVLMGEIDKVLEVPVNAMDELQARIDAMLDRFRELAPEAILTPLSGLFEPLLGALDALELEALVAPISEWHERARAGVQSVLPVNALAPLVEAHDAMVRAFDSISIESLLGSIDGILADIRAELERLEPAGLVEQLSSGVTDARELLARLSPEAVFTPLTDAHGRVAAGLAELAPTTVLAPLTELSSRLSALLAGVTDEDARLAAAAFAPLLPLPAAFDPRTSFETASAKTAEVESRLAALDLGTLLAQARSIQQSLVSALDAGASLAPRAQALDPLRDAQLAQAVADLQQVRGRLRGVFPSAVPPAELTSGYDEIRANVESLVPEWVRGTPTASSLRGAFAWLDPGTIVAGAESVHAELEAQWAAVDPQPIAAALETARLEVDALLAAVDPGAIAGRFEGLVGELGSRLDALSLQPVADEAQDVQAEVRGLLAALDPRPVIEQLEALAADVEEVVDGLDPAAVLAALAEPLERAKGLLRQFDPAALAEALQPAFAEIEAILDEVDLRVVLRPLVDRLQTLRTELESALERTESAFRDMIAAIPA